LNSFDLLRVLTFVMKVEGDFISKFMY